MRLSVFKDNKEIQNLDFLKEIEGNEGSELSFFVGRSSDCHVVLDDKQVSREHAELKYDGKLWSIKSLSEFSVLTINGSSSEETKLNNADVINIGPFVVKVEVENVVSESTPPVTEEKEDETEAEVEEESTGTMSEEEVLSDDDELADLDDDSELADLDDDDAEEVTDDEFGDETEVDESLDGEFSDDEDSELTEGDDELFGEEDSEGEEGFEDEYAVDTLDDDDDDGATRVIQAFATYKLGLDGEYAPYDTFLLDKPEVFIGRDPSKCQIVLQDPEVSSVHAVLRKSNISCVLEDLQSGNGTILNGERINKKDLSNHDEFIIGSTTFTVNVSSDFLKQEKDSLMPVEENQMIEVEEIVEVDENFEDGEEGLEGEGFGEGGAKNVSLFSKEALKDPEKRKKLIYIGVGFLLLLMFLPTEEEKPVVKNKKKAVDKVKKDAPISKLSPEQVEFVDSQYLLAKELYERGNYSDAILELDKIHLLIPEYKNSKQLKSLAEEGLKQLELLAEKERKEKANKARKIKVKELEVKAEKATNEKKVELAEGLFNKILELDPENFNIVQWRMEINAYKKKKEQEALEEAQRKAERKRQEDALSPGKNFFSKKEWYNAVVKLESFLKLQQLDEDLKKEAMDMKETAAKNLSNIVQPLIGKAQSLKEGQDLKGAYEHYKKVLEYDPSQRDALNEMNEILERLTNSSKRVYREAIIAESLSLFNDAKEKFQEVQQISPSDSEYYKKATEKLKEYLD